MRRFGHGLSDHTRISTRVLDVAFHPECPYVTLKQPAYVCVFRLRKALSRKKVLCLKHPCKLVQERVSLRYHIP